MSRRNSVTPHYLPVIRRFCEIIGRITDNCVGIAEEAMAEVSFITLNEEELKRMDFAPKTKAIAK